MLPQWLMKPETIYATVLFLLSPFFYLLAVKSLRKFQDWNTYTSERVTKRNIAYLEKALQNPPSLLSSIAPIVCFLPLPIAVAMMFCVLRFAPAPPFITPLHNPTAVKAIQFALTCVFAAVFFFLYVLFGMLTVYGIGIACRLRHGEARYVENYKAGIQKRMDRLKKKLALHKNL